jgi:hypothetical protein
MSHILSPAEADFWLDAEKYANYFDEQSDPANGSVVFSIDMVRLSSIRKAIANFVRILTRQNIPVYFNDADATVNFGGKTIYISAQINNKYDFDVAVGQALHEAAHTLKTDFDSVKIAWTNIPHHIFAKADAKNIWRPSLEKFIHTMWNVIEDRYIDDYVFNEAPGYRGYYVALYDRFFNAPEIDEYLASDMFRYPSLDSYAFRIINFTNENSDLLALPRLDEIAQVIDITNISRLKRTEDRLEAAFKVVEIVLDCLDKEDPKQQQGGQGQGKPQKGGGLARPEDFFDFGDGQESEEKEKDEKDSEGQSKDEKEQKANDKGGKDSKGDEKAGQGDDAEEVDVSKKMIEDMSDVMMGNDPDPTNHKENKRIVSKVADQDLDKDASKQIKDLVEGQRKFLRGEMPKAQVTPQQKQLLDLIEKHGIVLVRVDCPELLSGDDNNLKVDCIVVQEMTKELVLSGQEMFPLCGVKKFGLGKDDPVPPKEVADSVKKGIAIGTKLGRKLQIRNEVNPIKVIRKQHGKINRRQLHEAAFDAEDLFFKTRIEQHNKASLHITVDASSSMAGEKWNQTMTAVVAVCKATSMIDNVHVTVSFRATQRTAGTELPYVVLAYDSNVDRFSKVKTLFPYLVPNGCTPEGLAFGAIMGLFENITPDEEDRYFLNLSDGEPCYVIRMAGQGVMLSYMGETGTTHTKAQVDKIRAKGVDIMSYFITETPDESKDAYASKLKKDFQKMYGKNAQFINVESLLDLAKTMNRLFLTKATQ